MGEYLAISLTIVQEGVYTLGLSDSVQSLSAENKMKSIVKQGRTFEWHRGTEDMMS